MAVTGTPIHRSFPCSSFASTHPPTPPRPLTNSFIAPPPHMLLLVLHERPQLIVHAPTRPEAISGLRKALREFQVVGLPTNLDFCERVAGHRAFERGGVTTAFLEEHGEEVMPAPEARSPPPHAIVLAAVAVLLEEVCFPLALVWFVVIVVVVVVCVCFRLRFWAVSTRVFFCLGKKSSKYA